MYRYTIKYLADFRYKETYAEELVFIEEKDNYYLDGQDINVYLKTAEQIVEERTRNHHAKILAFKCELVKTDTIFEKTFK